MLRIIYRKWLTLAGVLLAAFACAPSIPRNEYGLEVIEDKDLYLRTVAEDSSKELVELQDEIPGIRLDIRYATSDNVMQEQLYPIVKALLRKPAAGSLAEVQQDLEARSLGLKVFDAYRPYEVTERMWEPIQNPAYVATPTKGSRHNRGCAVDLTLVGSSGEELLMPTGFDDFSEKAGHDYQDLPEEAIRNRELLREVMECHGFVALKTEWWHYDWQGWERFELLDLPLTSLP
ncbi:MAG TPA: M15 family metallopeptidase [Rubrobacteraceae bacterium]|nr:M15 family metallopeptidase [Rubrobacteraceae bacterium]